MKDLKTTQVEFLEMNNKMSKMKNTLNGITKGFDTEEEKIKGFEDITL